MLDIGTIPLPDSISWMTFYMNEKCNKNVGGVAGEIETFYPDNERGASKWDKFENYSLFLAQYIEYKLSHFTEKAFESCFGFISVLPGAFSMFWWKAI